MGFAVAAKKAGKQRGTDLQRRKKRKNSTMKTFQLSDLPQKYHHMVDSISDERDNDDGIWVYLNRPYLWDGEVAFVHEQTIAGVQEAFANVKIVIT